MANQRGKDIIVGAIAGTVLGAVTALLLAPKSGKELRKDIAEGVQQVSEKTQTVAKQIGTQTTELFGKAKDVTTQVVDQVRSWTSGGGKDDDELVIAAVAATEETAGKEDDKTLTIVR